MTMVVGADRIAPDDASVSRPAAPLGAWLVAGVLTVITIVGAMAYAWKMPALVSMKFVDLNRQRIAQLERETAGQGAYTVVLLGTSALKYATREEGVIAARLSGRLGAPVRVIRLVNNWGVFSDFEPLAETLIELRPDIVMMEPQFVHTDRPVKRRFLMLTSYLRWLMVQDDLWDEASASPSRVQFAQPCWERQRGRSIQKQLLERPNWVTNDTDGPSSTAARDFIAALLQHGSKVVLLDVPRRPDLQQATLDLRQTDVVEGMARSHSDILSWSPPPLPQSLYCDITHLAPQGRVAYSDWLEQQVAGLLQLVRTPLARQALGL